MAKHHSPEEKQARRAKKAQEWDARESYARGLMQGILSMLEPGDVVIDCGANLGAVAGPLADTGATVHAFEPDPYTFGRLSEALGGLFRGEQILDLWLEAERGIGRPPLMARMLLLPLIGSHGEPDLALGCFCTKGDVGRAPRRFTISRMLREPLPATATDDFASAFAELPRPMAPPRGRPNLRLVVSK